MKTFGPEPKSSTVPAVLMLLLLLIAGGVAAYYFYFQYSGVRTMGYSITIEDPSAPQPPDLPGDSKTPTPIQAANPRNVNLLAQVDVQRDTVHGKWELKNGELHGDATEGARIQFPYEVADEYDVLCDFTQLSGTSTFNVLLARGDKMFGYTIGLRSTTGFFDIAKEVPGQTTLPFAMQHGKKYALKIEVRNESVKAYMDGVLRNQWLTPFQTVPRWSGWHLKNNRYLGIGTWASPAIIHKFEIVNHGSAASAPRKPEEF